MDWNSSNLFMCVPKFPKISSVSVSLQSEVSNYQRLSMVSFKLRDGTTRDHIITFQFITKSTFAKELKIILSSRMIKKTHNVTKNGHNALVHSILKCLLLLTFISYLKFNAEYKRSFLTFKHEVK